SSVIRIADSSDPARRSTSARDSSPPASASVANSRPRLLTFEVKSMAPLWHHHGTIASRLGSEVCHVWHRVETRWSKLGSRVDDAGIVQTGGPTTAAAHEVACDESGWEGANLVA